MRDQKKYYVIAIVVSTVLITYLHHSIFREQSPHIVLEELYYLPLLLGALMFGLKGALLTYLFVSLFYLPYFFGDWATTFLSFFDRLLHLLFSGMFVFLAGFLVGRHRRLQEQFEKDRYLAGLGQVAAAIVHDLRNPLISILGFSKRIREGKGSVTAATQVIEESAQSMQRIVDGVLDFARPIRLDIREEDIHGVVQLACDSCRIKAEERKVALSMELPSTPVHVAIDRFSFQRALVNLVNNAIEASATGRNIIVRAETEKNHVVIKVKDFGSGMDKETLKNIFIPFYSKKEAGTGLGMAIAKKVVEGHGGKIRINSQPGIGTEVMVELPY